MTDEFKVRSVRMPEEVVISAQIRAARALLNWSQERLAGEAGVGATTVRDIESQRRPTDTGAMRQLRRAFENAGVRFVSGAADGGAGVRFVAGRPHLIRQPEMTKWDGLHFGVEWQGREIDVFVAYEVVADFGGFSSRQPDAAYVKVFGDYRDEILDKTGAALADGRINRHSRVQLTATDFPRLVPLHSLST
jgi:transcriptional regulator with XRE-family HTH domain